MTLLDTPMDAMLDSSHSKPKLLVVDDQPINIQVMHQVFGADYQVFMATNGEQALAICHANPPDLVLLDVVMPGVGGFEVCTQLKANPTTRAIPVIFVIAHSDAAQETHGLSVGAVDFISKPINPAVARARVKTHLTLKYQSELLRNLVFLDGLTGVFNRRYFDQQLGVEWGRAQRNGTPLSVILVDVDHFKLFNDRYGHQAGDDCLRQIAPALKSGLRRPADLVARYAGEQFACILPDTGYDEALTMAQQMERSVRAQQIPHALSPFDGVVTASLGLATRLTQQPSGDAAALMGLADAQLKRAKQAGRGRVCGATLGSIPLHA